MATKQRFELLFLHALPLDGSMWAAQKQLLPGLTYTPTLYPFGDSIEAWAAAALSMAKGDRLVVVGCSVGGSCALELAVSHPTGSEPSFSSGPKPSIGPTRRSMPQRCR